MEEQRAASRSPRSRSMPPRPPRTTSAMKVRVRSSRQPPEFVDRAAPGRDPRIAGPRERLDRARDGRCDGSVRGPAGTVWGIYNALIRIGATGQPTSARSRPRGRGADHDRDRPRRRDPGGAGLQLLRAPEPQNNKLDTFAHDLHDFFATGRASAKSAVVERRTDRGDPTMAFSSGGDGHNSVNATINIVPLVDVMLVLLIIFMVTAPLMAHRSRSSCSQANLDERPERPPAPPLTVAITSTGTLYLNDQPITIDRYSTFAVEAQKTPQPPVNAAMPPRHTGSSTRWSPSRSRRACARSASSRHANSNGTGEHRWLFHPVVAMARRWPTSTSSRCATSCWCC